MTITFRTLTISDQSYFPAGLELLNRTQGRDLFGPLYLEESVNDPQSLVVAAFDDEEIVAVGVAKLIELLEFYEAFEPGISQELSRKKVGSFSTLCVKENLQGKGIGQKISFIRLEWLKSHKCQVILGCSWVSGKSHTSDRVFTKLGFKQTAFLENAFLESSLKNPFICPGCEVQPCKCSAILFRLTL